jgi:hypothetical protein
VPEWVAEGQVDNPVDEPPQEEEQAEGPQISVVLLQAREVCAVGQCPAAVQNAVKPFLSLSFLTFVPSLSWQTLVFHQGKKPPQEGNYRTESSTGSAEWS